MSVCVLTNCICMSSQLAIILSCLHNVAKQWAHVTSEHYLVQAASTQVGTIYNVYNWAGMLNS